MVRTAAWPVAITWPDSLRLRPTAIRASGHEHPSTHTHDELATARGLPRGCGVRPRSVRDRHPSTVTTWPARTYFGVLAGDTSASVTCGIGFAEVQLHCADPGAHPAQLQDLLNDFDAAVTDVVHADGGWLVKLIGDAVMW